MPHLYYKTILGVCIHARSPSPAGPFDLLKGVLPSWAGLDRRGLLRATRSIILLSKSSRRHFLGCVQVQEEKGAKMRAGARPLIHRGPWCLCVDRDVCVPLTTLSVVALQPFFFFAGSLFLFLRTPGSPSANQNLFFFFQLSFSLFLFYFLFSAFRYMMFV